MAKIIVVSVQWRILVIAGPFWAAYRVRFLDGHHVLTSNLAWMEASKGCEVRGNGHGIIIVSDTDKSRHRTGMGQLIGECWHQWVPKKVQNTVLWKSVRCT